MDEGEEPIDDKPELRAVRRQARWVHVRAALFALAVEAGFVGIGMID